MEFIVYILFSESKNRFYIGFTSDLKERITRHNQKSKGFTGNVDDWKIVYFENYKTKAEALEGENKILEKQNYDSKINIKKIKVQLVLSIPIFYRELVEGSNPFPMKIGTYNRPQNFNRNVGVFLF